MTVDEIRKMDEDYLTAAQVAGALKMDVGKLVGYAKEGLLPFPTIMSGNRVKISRKGFLAWHDRKEPEPEADEKLMKELHYTNVQLTGIAAMLMAMMPKFVPEFQGKLAAMLDDLKGEKTQ